MANTLTLQNSEAGLIFKNIKANFKVTTLIHLLSNVDMKNFYAINSLFPEAEIHESQ